MSNSVLKRDGSVKLPPELLNRLDMYEGDHLDAVLDGGGIKLPVVSTVTPQAKNNIEHLIGSAKGVYGVGKHRDVVAEIRDGRDDNRSSHFLRLATAGT